MNERQKKILDFLTVRQTARMEEIVRAVHYSRSTVRRDLIELERLHAVTRSRGKASIIVTTSKEKHYRLRETDNTAEKETIARLCLPLLPANGSVFMDSGTTTACLCREIPYASSFTVITSGLETARLLLDRKLEDLLVHRRLYPYGQSLPCGRTDGRVYPPVQRRSVHSLGIRAG